MKRMILSCTLLALLLSGCGGTKAVEGNAPAAESQPPAAEQAAPNNGTDRDLTAAELGREERTVLEMSVEGETEEVIAELFIGRGYSLYIPEEGWRHEKDADDGTLEDSWESTVNDEVELEVRRYPARLNESLAEVKADFTRDRDYVFEDLMGGELGDPLTGMDEDGDFLSFMAAQSGDGTVYVISWEYPAEAAEGFGTRLALIANTFQLTE